MADDFSELINELSSTLLTIEKVLNVKNMAVEIKDLEIQASVPNLWDDPAAAQVVTTRLSFLQNELKKVLSLRQRLDDVQVLIQLATDENDASSITDAKNEINSLVPAIREMEVKTLLSGEYDSREALVTIRSEAGGVDAADWAEMLLRMYLRYCERQNWKTDVYETSYAEEAGIKSATFAVHAPYAYGILSPQLKLLCACCLLHQTTERDRRT
jgi:peptide chain release factor 2